MTCPNLEPCWTAYADQRIAAATDFVNGMVTDWAESIASGKIADDAVGLSCLSAVLDKRLTAAGAMSDALAVAIRKLAAK